MVRVMRAPRVMRARIATVVAAVVFAGSGVVGVSGATAGASSAHVLGVVAPKTALIFGPSVAGGNSSYEAQYLTSQGWAVTVASASQWDAMTAAQFASYQLLVLGDPECYPSSVISDAVSNESTWAPTVNGNVLVLGTDPSFHFSVGVAGAGALINGGLAFAGSQAGATNLYLDLSCYHTGADAVLSGLEAGFTIDPSGHVRSDATDVTALGAQNLGVTSSQLSNWHSSVHEFFSQWPTDFVPYAIVESYSGSAPCSPLITAPDGAVGCPYILARTSAPITGAPRGLVVTRTVSDLTVSWIPGTGGSPYLCTLLYGFTTPSTFTVRTSSSSCSFLYLNPSTSYGVKVASDSGVGGSAEIFSNPVPTTITCVRANHVRRVTAVNPRCPSGWRLRR